MSSYTKYKWKIVASDFNSAFFRNYIWTHSPLAFPEMFDLPIVLAGVVSRENAINYIVDMKSFTDAHESLKEKALKDFKMVENLIDDTNKYAESFNSWSEEKIFDVDLTNKSSDQLINLLKEFYKKQSVLYAYGITLPLLDFLGFSFVERKLEEYLKSKVSESEYQHYFDIFTYPLHNSFAQDQEENLLILMSEFYNSNWLQDIQRKSFDEIKSTYPSFYEKLKKHTEKYAWVYYVYIGPAFTDKQFYDFIQDYISKGVNPDEKLSELFEKKKQAHILREEAIEKFQPDSQYEYFLRLAGKMVWAKPRRKDYQSRSYYHVEKLHRELARRTFLSLSQVRSSPLEILEKLLKGEQVDTSIINSIFKLHVCVPDEEEIRVLYGREADEFIENYMEKEVEQDYADITELKGNVASPGRQKGKVKIVNRPEDMEKMESGDILVSVATTPSIVPAMKKAAAIVTDEGGLTCHAAIVSRELGITCLIGTKIATKVLKDGMDVEVDTEQGLVRIIK